MSAMFVSATGKIKKDYKQDIAMDNFNRPVTIWNVSYEVRSELIHGVIEANYLIYQSEEGITPELIRGFAEFEGTIDGQYGRFVAQEDGRSQNNIIKINGRIIDATDELTLLVGRYHYDGLTNESVKELVFDIEL